MSTRFTTPPVSEKAFYVATPAVKNIVLSANLLQKSSTVSYFNTDSWQFTPFNAQAKIGSLRAVYKVGENFYSEAEIGTSRNNVPIDLGSENAYHINVTGRLEKENISYSFDRINGGTGYLGYYNDNSSTRCNISFPFFFKKSSIYAGYSYSRNNLADNPVVLITNIENDKKIGINF